MSHISAVKIYGERNTGTNYLSKVIENNYRVKLLNGVVPDRLGDLIKHREWMRDLYFSFTSFSNLGWKHAVPMCERIALRNDVGVITLSKNPYSWLLSLFRRSYHLNKNHGAFADFLTAPCKVAGRENYSADIPNPIELWNIKNKSYLTVNHYAPCINMRYESLLQDPMQAVEEVAELFELGSIHTRFRNLDEASKKEDSGKSFEYYRHYYLEEKWRDKLQQADVDLINKSLDKETVTHYGYEIIDVL